MIALIALLGLLGLLPMCSLRWRGYKEEDDTWEPEESLNTACRELLLEYLRSCALQVPRI